MNWHLSNKEKAALLRERADFVEAIPEAEFNLDHWWLPDGRAFDDDRNRMYQVASGKCGCAVGHMMIAGLIDGLSMSVNKQLLDHGEATITRDRIFVLVGDTFGVSYKLAEFMFDGYCYFSDKSRAAVARRMRYIASELEALA
jgi:hypothetical protein